MKIGVIQASSQVSKNNLLFNAVKKYASDFEVINFGCAADEEESFSYIEISLIAGLLLVSGSVDFIVTGCSSGQGMMLAMNNIPGVLCGYAPTPKDAYLFAQINNGNAISLPLGENYTYSGEKNLEDTIKLLFSEPFGQGWPKADANRKLKDTELLKSIRYKSQVDIIDFLNMLDKNLVAKIEKKQNVINYIMKNGKDEKVLRKLETWYQGLFLMKIDFLKLTRNL